MEKELMAKYYNVRLTCPNPACNTELEATIQLTWDEQNILDHLTERYRDVPSSLLTTPGIRIKRGITCDVCLKKSLKSGKKWKLAGICGG